MEIGSIVLYTNNKRSEREIKKIIPFTIASERLKDLGRNLPKEGKYIYFENYKTPIKEIADEKCHKQTERYSMLLDCKNQYCQNDYSTQSNYKFNVIPFILRRSFLQM